MRTCRCDCRWFPSCRPPSFSVRQHRDIRPATLWRYRSSRRPSAPDGLTPLPLAPSLVRLWKDARPARFRVACRPRTPAEAIHNEFAHAAIEHDADRLGQRVRVIAEAAYRARKRGNQVPGGSGGIEREVVTGESGKGADWVRRVTLWQALG